MNTKYKDINIKENVVYSDLKRLINQVWKLIPLREESKDWKFQLQGVLIEITGLQEIFKNELDFLIVLSKLEGLFSSENFVRYRTDVFSIIHTLGEIANGIQ